MVRISSSLLKIMTVYIYIYISLINILLLNFFDSYLTTTPFIRGSGYYGQLAIQGTNISETPTMVPYFFEKQIPLTKIFCGTYHTAALSVHNKLYTWGSNICNCLGREIDETDNIMFTSKPGLCEVFGNVLVDGIVRGYPQSVAIGDHYTIVCSGPYEPML